MPLVTSSLAKICNKVRKHVDNLGQETRPADWDVTVSIGAPGVNVPAKPTENTLNLFFYRLEPLGFDADAKPGDTQWYRVMCLITAFGIDEDTNDDHEEEFSSGFNELRMLSQVIRLFQEQPIMMFEGDDGEVWHTQFVPRPLMDEQINQIWSSQGDTIYRPSIVYEIALAPVEPLKPTKQSTRVGSIGSYATNNIEDKYRSWPTDREVVYPATVPVTVDTTNPQWAPALMMITGDEGERLSSLSLNYEVPLVGDNADFTNFPKIDLWIAGDISKTNDLMLVGQLLQNPDKDKNGGQWKDIDTVKNISADTRTLDVENLPAPAPDASAVGFTLQQEHWSGLNASHNNWQLQLFIERFIRLDPATNAWVDAAEGENGVRIRSNPVLISITRKSF